LRLDVGKLFGSTVGESEKNIRRCIQLAEAVSPCILWIDEIDKAFGGVSGYQGDSGTQLRVFGTFITWLQEKEEPVFVISTANEPKNLPPGEIERLLHRHCERWYNGRRRLSRAWQRGVSPLPSEREPLSEELRSELVAAVRDFLESSFEATPAPDASFSDRQLQVAAAVLFVQMVRADLEHRQDEHRALERAVQRALGLAEDAAAMVIRLAEEQVETSAAFHEFVQVVDRRCSHEQKKQLTQSLWRLAYSDAELQGHEEYLVRKTAELLGLSTADLVETKVAAREAFLREDL
jgi:uncharacterized tellurite resistance protein B-like protein